MNTAQIAGLVVLAIGATIFVYVLATWRRRDHSSRATGCALAAFIMAISAWIAALS